MDNKIIVSQAILADAYNNAFLNLEQMNYRLAGKLLEFVETNHYPVDREMVDYANVIIYSNVGRVDEALTLSEGMIARGVNTPGLEPIVIDVHSQLLKQKEMSDKRKQKLKKVSIADVKNMLDLIKPTDSKLAMFINFFSNDMEEENFLLNYYQNGKIDESHQFMEYLKMTCGKLNFISDTYNTALACNEEAAKPLYAILSKTLLSTNMEEESLLFMAMHKAGLLKKILVSEFVVTKLRSYLAFQLDNLYANGLIGRVKVKMLISNDIYEDNISNLNKSFYGQFVKYADSLDLFLKNENIDEEARSQIFDIFLKGNTYTYPVVNPIGIAPDKYVAAFLYVVSNNNYNSQFNAIIEDVYKLNHAELKEEIEMIEVLILI